MDPIDRFLPELPPTGGPVVCTAGRLTEANLASERVPGPASQGLVGDYFMRNDRIRVIVQAPGRDIAVVPFGGNLIDADLSNGPRGDQLGEVAPFLQLGRSVEFTRAVVVRDGAEGGPAVLRFYGHDAVDSYINLTGVGPITRVIGEDYRASVDLMLEVAVTYVLRPGESHVEATYTFYNPRSSDVATSFGTITDTGADVEVFHPGFGFGEAEFDDLLAGAGPPPVEYFGLQGQGIAYGVVPIYDDPAVRGLGLALAGVDVEVHGVKSLFEAIGGAGQTLRVPSQGAAQRTVDLFVGADLGDVERAVRAHKGQESVVVQGTVVWDGTTEPVAGARVIAEDASADPSFVQRTVLVTDDQGRFVGALPPGAWRFQAEADGFLRGTPQTLTLPSGGVGQPVLTVPAGATIGWKVQDRAGTFIPAKVVVVGSPPATPDRRFREVDKEPLPLGVAAWRTSLEGDSSKGTRWDQPIRLLPGRYRVVIGRGPEWSRFETIVDLGAGGATVSATLDRVLDTTGYVAADFHQHTYWSPDAPVPPMDRVVAYLADGVELVATTEHDYHLDLAPTVNMLGASSLLATMVGVEVTPFSYGHFIAYPMPVNPLSPSGGAFDWAFDPGTGLDVPPSQIFAGLRALGAQVVQMNHPRALPEEAATAFQENFDRAGLTYDFVGRSFGGQSQLQPLTAIELGLPDGAELFSPEFDTLEVYNGGGFTEVLDGDRRVDGRTEQVMRDWMNFLSFGFTPTALGNSDSHEWFNVPPGTPRTMVRVEDDGPAAIAGGGLPDEVVRRLKGQGVPRDVVVTNAPMIALTVDGEGIGRMVSHPSGTPLQITVRVQSPAWAPVDTIELFANETFDIPPPKGQAPASLSPAICFTSRATPSQRCTAALGGARPVAWTKVKASPGVFRWEATVTADVDPEALLARQRAGASGKDLWLLARVTGDVGLFPFVPSGITDPADVPSLVENATTDGKGVPALAFTNPVFVDVDGGGWKAPFAR